MAIAGLALCGCTPDPPVAASSRPLGTPARPPTLEALSAAPATAGAAGPGVEATPDRTAGGTRTPPTTGGVARPLRGLVIALDPGHNGGNARYPAQINRPVDAGGFRKPCNTMGTASASGYPEATFTWQLAGRVRDLLQQRGARVRTTRTSNAGWGPCVDARGRFGTSVHAVLELSLHADGAAPTGHGFHVIVPAYRRGYTDDILGPSARLGGTVRDTLRAAGFSPSTYAGRSGVQVRADLGTLNLAGVPTVLVECGNMRNAADAAVLGSPAGQHRYAVALTAALQRFLGR